MKHLQKFNERITHKQQQFYDEYKILLKAQEELIDAEEGEEYQDDELEGLIWDKIKQHDITKADINYILQYMDTSFDTISYGQTTGFLQRIHDSEEWKEENLDDLELEGPLNNITRVIKITDKILNFLGFEITVKDDIAEIKTSNWLATRMAEQAVKEGSFKKIADKKYTLNK